MHALVHLTGLLLLLSAATVHGGGSCTVVPKGETGWPINRPRRYWCQVNCPVANSKNDSHELCPFYSQTSASQNCGADGFAVSTATSCNQGYSGAACPPAGSGCIDCVRSEMQCTACDDASLCSQTNGFSVTSNGVTSDLGSCDHSDGELTTCDGRERSACGYVCTGHCERGFSSSWKCNFAAREGSEQLISRCERKVVDDSTAECDLSACDNGCMSAFLVRVQAGNISGWDLSYPLGTTGGAASAQLGRATLLAATLMGLTWSVLSPGGWPTAR